MVKTRETKTAETFERQQHRYICLIRSLESKLDQVEPSSNEFNDVEEQLFNVKKSVKLINYELVKLRYIDFIQELQERVG